jgi:hypothetical protein
MLNQKKKKHRGRTRKKLKKMEKSLGEKCRHDLMPLEKKNLFPFRKKGEKSPEKPLYQKCQRYLLQTRIHRHGFVVVVVAKQTLVCNGFGACLSTLVKTSKKQLMRPGPPM